MLLIKLYFPIWQALLWNKAKIIEELIILKIKQFKWQEISNKKAQKRVHCNHLANKEYFNKTKNTYKGKLEPKELILI